jgi:hypothetical protein
MGNHCTSTNSIELSEPIPDITPAENEPHYMKMTSHFIACFPPHERRKNTNIYNHTHHQLCHVQDMPCFICGKTHKTDGIALETHHFYIEKAAQNAVDWIAFGNSAKNLYNIQTGQHIGSKYDWSCVAKNPDLFVDSPDNMIVLCKEHHISGNKGIHHVPFPNWILQKYPRDGFQFLV